jgi:hypothetical protein
MRVQSDSCRSNCTPRTLDCACLLPTFGFLSALFSPAAAFDLTGCFLWCRLLNIFIAPVRYEGAGGSAPGQRGEWRSAKRRVRARMREESRRVIAGVRGRLKRTGYRSRSTSTHVSCAHSNSSNSVVLSEQCAHARQSVAALVDARVRALTRARGGEARRTGVSNFEPLDESQMTAPAEAITSIDTWCFYWHMVLMPGSV